MNGLRNSETGSIAEDKLSAHLLQLNGRVPVAEIKIILPINKIF